MSKITARIQYRIGKNVSYLYIYFTKKKNRNGIGIYITYNLQIMYVCANYVFCF